MRIIWAITTAALFSTTVGCVGYTSNIRSTTGAAKQAPPSLSGLSASDLIKTKYNKAILTCELRKQKGTKLNESTEPDDSVSWDLINDYADSKTLSLKASLNGDVSIAILNFTKISIKNLTLFAANGKVYKMENSPAITVEFKERTDEVEGGWTGMQVSSDEVNEGVPEALLDSTRMELDGSTFTKVTCLLSTEAKPEYQGQFSVR